MSFVPQLSGYQVKMHLFNYPQTYGGSFTTQCGSLYVVSLSSSVLSVWQVHSLGLGPESSEGGSRKLNLSPQGFSDFYGLVGITNLTTYQI